jgi:membrane fusion protein (multidrug efflux system)
VTTSTDTENETPVRRVASGLSGRLGTPTRSLRQRLRLPLMLAGPIVVALVAGWWYVTSGRYVETDDAYIQAAKTMISPDVSGRVIAVAVKDNDQVKKGQVLFRFDPITYQLTVDRDRAELAAARLQVNALKATYRQKLADEQGAEDTLAYQQREYDRQKRLVGSGVASQAQFDQAQNGLEVARQHVAATQHDIGNTLAQLGGNPDIAVDDHPMVQRAKAALDIAQVDLDDTVIKAPEDGVVTKVEQLQVGDYITAATPVFSMMSNNVWVEANYKETELTHMRAGQTATVEVDTYPGVDFKAKLASLSPGTGLTFSLLPPENATGNWVKVVQRLPVRLALDNADPDHPLRAGMSVTVEVDTKYHRPLLDWIQASFARLFGSAHADETAR